MSTCRLGTRVITPFLFLVLIFWGGQGIAIDPPDLESYHFPFPDLVPRKWSTQSGNPNVAQLKWSEDFADVIQEFELKEQVCINGGVEAQLRKSEDRWIQLNNVAGSGTNLFKEVGMIVIDPPPKTWKMGSWEIPELENWQKRWRAADENRKCQLVQLSYLFAIWQVSTLAPEKPVLSLKEILIKEVTPDVERDRRRASWAFRFIKAIPEKEIPKSCHRYVIEAIARYQYIHSDRKPLGFAVGMCGRTMNAHYIDDEVNDKKRPRPQGWDGSEPAMEKKPTRKTVSPPRGDLEPPAP